jgi:hypothetical protein
MQRHPRSQGKQLKDIYGPHDIQLNDTQHYGLFVTLSINEPRHKQFSAYRHSVLSVILLSVGCHYAECRNYLNVMLSVTITCSAKCGKLLKTYAKCRYLERRNIKVTENGVLG